MSRRPLLLGFGPALAWALAPLACASPPAPAPPQAPPPAPPPQLEASAAASLPPAPPPPELPPPAAAVDPAACALDGTNRSAPLRFYTPSGKELGTARRATASLRLSSGDSGVVLVESAAVSLRASARPAEVPVHYLRIKLGDDGVYLDGTAPVRISEVKGSTLRATADVASPLYTSASGAASVTLEGPCADFSPESGTASLRRELGLAATFKSIELRGGRDIALRREPNGALLATLRFPAPRKSDPSSADESARGAEELERKGPNVRVAWPIPNRHASLVGWVLAKDLAPPRPVDPRVLALLARLETTQMATLGALGGTGLIDTVGDPPLGLGPGAPGDDAHDREGTIGAGNLAGRRGAGPAATSARPRVTCPATIALVAELDGERLTLGELHPNQVFSIVEPGETWTRVAVPAVLLAEQATLLVRTGDLASCAPR